MNKAFWDSRNKDLGENIKSLKELSAPEEYEQKERGKQPVLDGCPNCEKIVGVDFDAVRRKWHPKQRDTDTNVPCSVDALVLTGEGLFLIEFKSGKVDKANLYRKIYDSLIMLFEHDNQNIKTMRQSATCILVATQLQSYMNTSTLRSICYGRKELWLSPKYKDVFDRWDLKNLEGFVVSKTYCMPPRLFDRFVKIKRWS